MVNAFLLVRPHSLSLRLILIGFAVFATSIVHAQSLRFYGNGVSDIDRVKIRIDDPASYSDPSPPADIGATDFTIEMWLKPTSDNSAGQISCGSGYTWIIGNVVLDRDRYNQGRSFGLSLGAGRVAFGVSNSSGQATTLCGGPDLRDGGWHHVAVQRRRSDGYLWLYIDGQLQAQASGPSGDVSYPDDGVPGNYCGSSRSQACTNSDPFIVLGAEKHDVSSAYPSYRGWMDELRISRTLRYSSNFNVPSQALVSDGNTAALYHFDEGTGNDVIDQVGNRSPGVRRYGGSPAGPVWATESPFLTASTGQVSFSTTSYSGSEGGAGVVVAVSRSGGSSGAASVDYSISNGSAVAGSDFSSTSGTLRWAAGESGDRTFTVTLINDTTVENAESATLRIANAIGAGLGSRTSATLNVADNDTPPSSPGAGGGTSSADSFARADSATIGNGWIEKNAAAFSLVGGRVTKHATSADYRSNLLYRPSAEDLTNVEVTAELRFSNTAVGYPSVVARVQNPTLTNGFSGYLFSISGTQTGATVSRQNGTGWDTILTRITLSSSLNTTDTYRLRLRVTGTTTVTLNGYVERLSGSTWQVIGSASVTDSSSSRISGSGSVGLTGDFESSYSWDNWSRAAVQ